MRWPPLAAALLLTGCVDEFDQHQVLRSPEGVFATIGIPPSGDSYTVCLAEQPLRTCPRSEAVFYSYRGLRGSQRWAERNVLLIQQVGGEVSSPPPGSIRVGRREVAVRLDYRPCPREQYWTTAC
jgi:hypothetical protein